MRQAADRRFNRARYDADRTVTAFAARLQGEVDLGTVRADLLGTVNQTLEPVQLSIWLIGADPGMGPPSGVVAPTASGLSGSASLQPAAPVIR